MPFSKSAIFNPFSNQTNTKMMSSQTAYHCIWMICLVGVLGCSQNEPKEDHSTIIAAEPAPAIEAIVDTPKTELPEEAGDTIWGYRFEVVGDFDGDQQLDTMREYFTEVARDYQETFKRLSNVEIGDYQGRTNEREGFLAVDDDRIHPLWLQGALGAAYVEVIPDITGDGADELGVINNHADYSNTNEYIIYTYDKRVGWAIFYSFSTMEYELPLLPIMTGYFPEDGGGAVLSLVDTKGNQKLIERLAAYQYAKRIAPKTLELVEYFPNSCEALDPTPVRVEATGSWVRILPEKLPARFSSYEIFVEEKPDPQTGRMGDWCDPATLYKIRVQFR